MLAIYSFFFPKYLVLLEITHHLNLVLLASFFILSGHLFEYFVDAHFHFSSFSKLFFGFNQMQLMEFFSRLYIIHLFFLLNAHSINFYFFYSLIPILFTITIVQYPNLIFALFIKGPPNSFFWL